MRSVPTRRLIWVPIIHTRADLGSLSGLARHLYVRRVGQTRWNRHVESVEGMWEAIRRAVEALDLPARGLRLYQDGLPNCGHEMDIVRDLARAGSPNHQLLLDLVAKGAVVTGTESPELLLQEYELTQQILTRLESAPAGVALRATLAESAKRGRAMQGPRELGKALLEKRDRYLADRIDRTLSPQETGLVFLGMLHSLTGLLPANVQVTRLRYAHRLT
jgi:hypothetical protein